MEGKNIIVSLSELKSLREAIVNKYQSSLEEVPHESEKYDNCKFNSNPQNYDKIQDSIVSQLRQILELDKTTPLKLGNLFLRKVLYESVEKSKDLFSFRKERIDYLYIYVYGKKRKEVLNENTSKNIELIFKKSPSLGVEEIVQKLHNNHQVNIGSTSATNIYSLKNYINDISNRGVQKRYILYINADFLLDIDLAEQLIDLINNYSWFYLDEDISLIFDDEILMGEKSILSWSGRAHYKGKWEEQLVIVKKLTDTKDKTSESSAQVEKIKDVIIPLLNSLEKYYKYWSILSEKDKRRVDNLQPFLKGILNIKAEKLKSIVSDSESKYSTDYLCMIGYGKYFTADEEESMENYFKHFNQTLSRNGGRIFRAFAVPSTIHKNKFRSNLTKKQNSIVKKYLQVNSENPNSRSFVVFYDLKSKQPGIEENLLFEQDYVISIQRDENEEEYFNNKELRLKKFAARDNLDLYLAFPEDEKLNNRVLHFKSKNLISVKKWVRDFILKLNPDVFKNNLSYTCLEYNSSINDENSKILEYLNLDIDA